MPRKTTPQPGPATLPSPARRQALARRLRAWYRRHRRELPWRRSADPYRVWISEIMLQQTQVATVVPYFERFLAAFPTVETLAAADEHAVLRLWEGLGYYRRARQVHRAARLIVSEHGGQFPRALAEVVRLPGVGRYTAGAIVSIAYDQPAPILEANTVRLLSRLVAFEQDTATTAASRVLWQLAEAILPPRGCGEFNQALMELGSLVCTPRNPACDRCPLAALCAARAAGRQREIPRVRARPPVEAVREAAVVVYRRGQVFVRRRSTGERWAGLWDFVRFGLTARRDDAVRQELIDKVRQQSGLTIDGGEKFASLQHGVTRFKITLDCYRAECRRARCTLPARDWQWIDPHALDGLALSATGRKLGRLLRDAPPP